jgi:hypothetical protein
MGRVFGIIQVGGRRLKSLFDPEVPNTYIPAEAAKGLPTTRLRIPRRSHVGGKLHMSSKVCLLAGTLEGHAVDLAAYVLKEVGEDEDGRPIDLIVGLLAMRQWNIVLLPEEQRLDLHRVPKGFIEFTETPAAP